MPTGLYRQPAVRLKVVRIAVELDMARHWNRRVMSGIVRYANECGKWELFTADIVGLSVLRRDDPRGFDGAIVPAYNPSPWPEVVPSVYIGTSSTDAFGPTFSTDNVQVCRLAAEHLTAIGFTNIAFVGIQNTTFTIERWEHFQKAVADRGRTCIQFYLPGRNEATYTEYLELLTQWLSELPLPCALLAADDELAALVITAGRECGLRVPEELAVLGVNNDDLWCSSVVPSLSSVSIAADEIGWHAADHLDHLIQGRAAFEPKKHCFAPTGIVVRRSSDVVGYDNPIVSEAVLLIRARAPREAVTVEQIAEDLHVSRQYLSQCFETHVGRSVKAEVDRVRIGIIREALQNGTASPKKLAIQMGFSDLSQFSRFCRRLLGQSPRSISKRNVSLPGI